MFMDSTDDLGIAFKHLCATHKYRPKDIADLFEVTPATVYNWMAGRSLPSGAKLIKLRNLVQRMKELPLPQPNTDHIE
jgi:DNA-binding transcriptional regulator YiaG